VSGLDEETRDDVVQQSRGGCAELGLLERQPRGGMREVDVIVTGNRHLEKRRQRDTSPRDVISNVKPEVLKRRMERPIVIGSRRRVVPGDRMRPVAKVP